MQNKTETTFKITRFPKTSSLLDTIVKLAAKSNGLPADKKLTMDDFISYIKCEIIQYPFSNSGFMITKLDNYHLVVDIDSEPALEIIEIETIELPSDIDYIHSAN